MNSAFKLQAAPNQNRHVQTSGQCILHARLATSLLIGTNNESLVGIKSATNVHASPHDEAAACARLSPTVNLLLGQILRLKPEQANELAKPFLCLQGQSGDAPEAQPGMHALMCQDGPCQQPRETIQHQNGCHLHQQPPCLPLHTGSDRIFYTSFFEIEHYPEQSVVAIVDASNGFRIVPG